MVKRRARSRVPDPPFREPYVGPPTVVNLEVDYGYSSILVNRSPGIGDVWELTPEELGLSVELAQRLTDWLDRWYVLSHRWVNDLPETEESRRAGEQSDRQLLALAFDVQHALAPEVEVRLNGLPPGEHRR